MRCYITEAVHGCNAMYNETLEKKEEYVLMEDIVLFSRSTSEAETMLKELNEAGKRIGLPINRTKTQFMKNVYCEDEGVQLESSQIVNTSSYLYLARPMSMKNDLKEELNRRIKTV
ncbi:hypothetical protein RB195_010430 [Necator americanus]|uniref:Reverse transcriptase domain-containing protein n=1 Tax=Necator americanus TaxID=51031 RepID=A0ABR1D0A2_NECAM